MNTAAESSGSPNDSGDSPLDDSLDARPSDPEILRSLSETLQVNRQILQRLGTPEVGRRSSAVLVLLVFGFGILGGYMIRPQVENRPSLDELRAPLLEELSIEKSTRKSESQEMAGAIDDLEKSRDSERKAREHLEERNSKLDSSLEETRSDLRLSELRVHELDQRRQSLEGQLRSQAAVGDHLQEQLEQKSLALDDALSRIGKPDETSRDEIVESDSTEDGAKAGITRVNESLEKLGVLSVELLHADEVGVDALIGTAWATFDERGRPIGGLHADTATLEIDTKGKSATLNLSGGFEIKDGIQTPFTNDRSRLTFTKIKVESWPWDSLAAAMKGEVTEESATKVDATAGSVDLTVLSARLQELLSPYGHELVKLGSISNGHLLDVRIDGPQPGGRGRRAIRAPKLRVNHVTSGAYVEMIFENGTVEDSGGRRPFYDNSMRIPLPEADVQEWKRSLPGLIHERS